MTDRFNFAMWRRTAEPARFKPTPGVVDLGGPSMSSTGRILPQQKMSKLIIVAAFNREAT
jgi:hypothetical protein